MLKLSIFVIAGALLFHGGTDNTDRQLRKLTDRHGLTGDPATGRQLPSIDEPLAQLGKKLFFSKALGGEFDTACASCHHPALGGADGLSLPVGVGAIHPDLLGPGRGDADGLPNVPRNAPTTFNVGLWDRSLFMDSRVESLGAEPGMNGAASGISTPDSGVGVIDANAGANLAVAQARFPVTSVEEMRGGLERGSSNDVLRDHLAARIGSYGIATGELGDNDWLAQFQLAFGSSATARELITFDNIVLAIGEYERSQLFIDNPWAEYLRGNDRAISEAAKLGAILFLTDTRAGGAGCVSCHSGDTFTDERHHTTGTPQFGPGKGNGVTGNEDFGRENVTGSTQDRYRFRTPSLLNVEVTGPYMHAGAYASLTDVVEHYADPRGKVDEFFDNGGWCQLAQYIGVRNCPALYYRALHNTRAALNKIIAERKARDPDALPGIALNAQQRRNIVEFLNTLTDPCVKNRECMSPWIPQMQEAPDAFQLNAVRYNGDAL